MATINTHLERICIRGEIVGGIAALFVSGTTPSIQLDRIAAFLLSDYLTKSNMW